MSIASDQAVVIWGEVLWDRFPDGEQLGGAPANVAWHLGLAGGWAQLVTRVGDDDAGRRAIAKLADVCDTSLVQVDRERATGVVEVTVDHGEARYRLVPGRAWERISCTDDVKAALADAGVVVYGTLAQRTPEGLASWREAIAATPASCVKVCDVNLRKRWTPRAAPETGVVDGRDLRPAGSAAEGRRGFIDAQAAPEHDQTIAIREALHVADIVKVNDRELAVLAGWFGWSDPIAGLREHHRIVAITHGAGGSTIYGETSTARIAGVAARPGGDNVGCGDAYLAILVHGMTLGWDLAATGRVASRWASAVAAVRGATPHFTDEQVTSLLVAA